MSDLTAISRRPGDPGYDDTATVYVRTGTPQLVLRAAGPDDVAAGVRHAVIEGLPLSVRSGGHSLQGWGTNDGGVVIDVRGMAEIELIDEPTGRFRIGAGAVWGDVADAMGKLGFALTSGDTRSVGVGGLATGGGIGWMVRAHGLTIDNILAADVVTADGRQLHASAEENPDLFWAIRGGGGNFGVVTSLEVTASRVSQVHAGMIMYTADDVPGVIRGWAEAHRRGPVELNSTLVLMPELGAPMPPAGLIGLVCYAGPDKAAADEALAPLLALGTVVMSEITEKAYADLLEEAQKPPGLKTVGTCTLLREIDDDVISALCEWYAGGTTKRMAFLRAMGGAVNRVDPDATAFAHRDVEALVLGGVFGAESADEADLLAELAGFDVLHELGVGSYPGFTGTKLPADIGRIYPPATLARLREIKRKYDPDNVFRANFNIEP